MCILSADYVILNFFFHFLFLLFLFLFLVAAIVIIVLLAYFQRCLFFSAMISAAAWIIGLVTALMMMYSATAVNGVIIKPPLIVYLTFTSVYVILGVTRAVLSAPVWMGLILISCQL